MIAQRTIAAVAAALVAGSVLAAVAAQGQVHTDARIAALIASLDGPAWENAGEELAALGERAVGPLIEVLRIGKGIAARCDVRCALGLDIRATALGMLEQREIFPL